MICPFLQSRRPMQHSCNMKAEMPTLLICCRGFDSLSAMHTRVRCRAPPRNDGPQIYAVFAAFNPSRCSTASRIRNFWILPVTVIGNSSTNST